MDLINLLRPGLPGEQPVGDLGAAKSAIFVGVLNGLVPPPFLELCLCDDVEQRCYQLASFVVAILGVALLVVDMAFPATLFSSPLWLPAVRWIIWITKVLTGGTLQLGINLLHLCLKMVFARSTLTLPLF